MPATKISEHADAHASRVIVRPFTNFGEQKNFAAAQATHDWIVSLDADEALSEELRASLAAWKQGEPECTAYEFTRRTNYLGGWIRHSGWYPDHQMRLYRKDASFWDGVAPHETARVKGKVERLSGHILHYTKKDLSEYHRTIDSYTTLAAAGMSKGGRVGSAAKMFFGSIAGFLRAYIIKQGFRDGVQGLMIAMFTAYGVFLKYAKLWETNTKPE